MHKRECLSCCVHWLLFRYRAKIIAVNETEGTVRYKLLECIDDDSGSGKELISELL